MKKSHLLKRIFIINALLVGILFTWNLPNNAQSVASLTTNCSQIPGAPPMDCETRRFCDWQSANDNYTVRFNLLRNIPVSCSQVCNANNCATLPTQAERDACILQANICIMNCEQQRLNDYLEAQNQIVSVSTRSCPFNPDQCAIARARRDECVAINEATWAHPVYDENTKGAYDSDWLSFALNQYSTCLQSSGIQNCE